MTSLRRLRYLLYAESSYPKLGFLSVVSVYTLMHAVGAYLSVLVYACIVRMRLSALGLRPA